MTLSRRRFLALGGLGVTAAALGGGWWWESDRAVAPAGHCLWGAYLDPAGSTAKQALQSFESMIGRDIALTRHYILWDRDLVNEPIRQSSAGGRIPFIGWQPQRTDGTKVLWADIASGSQDRWIRQQALLVRTFDRPAYFVFNHEPENDPLGTPDQFTAAFDHLRRVFDDAGADQLTWIATLMRGTYQGARGGADAWLPDSADLIGADGYNRGACNQGIGWESFESIFSSAHKYATESGKKLVLEEWGCVEAGDCGGVPTESKADWLRAAGATLRSWPEVAAVVYTNKKAEYRGRTVDFRVDTTPQALEAYRELGLQPYFLT